MTCVKRHLCLQQLLWGIFEKASNKKTGRGQEWAKDYIKESHVYLPCQPVCGLEIVGKVKDGCLLFCLLELRECHHGGRDRVGHWEAAQVCNLDQGRNGAAKDQGSCCQRDSLNDSWQAAFSKNGSTIFLVPHALLEPNYSSIKT